MAITSKHFYEGFYKRAFLATGVKMLAKPVIGVGKAIFGKGVGGAINAGLTLPTVYSAAKSGATVPGAAARTAYNVGRQNLGVTI